MWANNSHWDQMVEILLSFFLQHRQKKKGSGPSFSLGGVAAESAWRLGDSSPTPRPLPQVWTDGWTVSSQEPSYSLWRQCDITPKQLEPPSSLFAETQLCCFCPGPFFCRFFHSSICSRCSSATPAPPTLFFIEIFFTDLAIFSTVSLFFFLLAAAAATLTPRWSNLKLAAESSGSRLSSS